jgi:hypothetical protein
MPMLGHLTAHIHGEIIHSLCALNHFFVDALRPREADLLAHLQKAHGGFPVSWGGDRSEYLIERSEGIFDEKYQREQAIKEKCCEFKHCHGRRVQ